MNRTDPRMRRALSPVLDILESRRLLTVTVVSDGQDGHDILGPDAGHGLDAAPTQIDLVD
jgi:hypothetical protein